jgi:hypothetical protein
MTTKPVLHKLFKAILHTKEEERQSSGKNKFHENKNKNWQMVLHQVPAQQGKDWLSEESPVNERKSLPTTHLKSRIYKQLEN